MHFKHSFIWSALALSIAISSQAAQAQPMPSEQTIGTLEQVFAFHDAMPTGVSVAENGRIFVNFPR
ncbi:gluconolaconase, partial [Salmonella enterica subsp. enterica]